MFPSFIVGSKTNWNSFYTPNFSGHLYEVGHLVLGYKVVYLENLQYNVRDLQNVKIFLRQRKQDLFFVHDDYVLKNLPSRKGTCFADISLVYVFNTFS